jgi:hypothetical protein
MPTPRHAHAPGPIPTTTRDRELRRDALTFAAVAERYMTEVARPHRKVSTVRTYEALMRKHVLPALGDRRVTGIERVDVLRIHQQIGQTSPGAANRPQHTNPCYKIPKFKGRKMER